MANRNEMSGLEAGATMAALPLDSMISMLGVGIAKAQEALDQNSIATAVALSSATMDVPVLIDPNDPSAGTAIQSRSLLSLGFLPTFYQFTEATLELRIEMKIQVEENLGAKGSMSADMKSGPVAIAGTVSADYGRKYGAESSAMTHVQVTMVAVPPPAEFLEFVRKLDALPA
jgi:hypothetical protein